MKLKVVVDGVVLFFIWMEVLEVEVKRVLDGIEVVYCVMISYVFVEVFNSRVNVFWVLVRWWVGFLIGVFGVGVYFGYFRV